MEVKVKIPRLLNEDNNIIEIDNKVNTVEECIKAVISQHPILKGEILNDQNKLNLKWMIYINNKLSSTSNILKQSVREGDVVLILPVIAGG